MTLHISAGNWQTTDVNSFNWQVLNFYDGLVRFGVPVFVMISGALFLDTSKDIPIRKIFSKYIPRIAAAFIFWSFVYAARNYVKTGDILKAFGHLVRGHYHLWFLFMITGMYMLIPFLRKIAESPFLTKYFLVLALIFTFLLPECAKIISVFSEKYGTFAAECVNNFHMRFVGGFTGYFLLGYVLDKISISPKLERIIYFAGFAGVSMTILMSGLASVFRNEHISFYGDLTVNVMCESVAVFVFFRQHLNHDNKAIRKLSQYSFGAYLVHDAVIGLLRQGAGLHSLTFNPVVSVPVTAALVFILSFTISCVINHIPVLKKYIV